MILARTRAELAEALASLTGETALVMTMGALHEGHLSLVRRASELAPNVVVSIYVNPLQFGPNEDFDAYPRQLDADCALLEPLGVAVVFAPSDEEMYPRTPLVRIDPGPVATMLEGTTRPDHFAGVLQVVHKVMNLVRPSVALFGQKDAQQLALIRTMVADLDMPLAIEAVPIVRDDDGVARSSRNTYLSPEERIQARSLSQALQAGTAAAADGEGAEAVLAAVRESIEQAISASGGVIRLDYAVLVDAETFVPLVGQSDIRSSSAGENSLARGASDRTDGLLAIAAWVGTTRIIDNTIVSV